MHKFNFNEYFQQQAQNFLLEIYLELLLTTLSNTLMTKSHLARTRLNGPPEGCHKFEHRPTRNDTTTRARSFRVSGGFFTKGMKSNFRFWLGLELYKSKIIILLLRKTYLPLFTKKLIIQTKSKCNQYLNRL